MINVITLKLGKAVKNKKDIDKKKILRELYFYDSLSCAELGKSIHKSLPLTTKLIYELLEEGFIAETGFATSTGGRRPQTFAIAQNVMYVVSVAMDQLITKIAIMDMQNNFVSAVERIELPLAKNDEAVAILSAKIVDVIKKAAIPKEKIIGVGIAMPGFVNIQKGINYSFLFTDNKSISKIIADKVGIPVYIDNDSSLIALAELRFGVVHQKKNVMVLNIGWGVGLGLVLNGELFRGHDGFAGEFSHIPLFNNNKLCACGKSGCLETETSMLVLIEKAKEGINANRLTKLSSLSFDDYEKASEAIILAAQEGDQFAAELFRDIGYNIGRGVAVLIHLLNPEVVVLSGRGSAAGKILKAPIQQALNEHSIPILAQNTTIEVSAIGYQAELMGAAALVMENLESIPLNGKQLIPAIARVPMLVV